MDTYADDLHSLRVLDLKNAILVGHSTGGGEATRYVGRHGTKRVAKAVLISAVPPWMVKGEANREGIPLEVFDEIRSGIADDRSQFLSDFTCRSLEGTGPARRFLKGCAIVLAAVHAGRIETSLRLREGVFGNRFHRRSEKVRRADAVLARRRRPDRAHRTSRPCSSKMVERHAEGLPRRTHGLTVTHRDQFNADLLAFIKSSSRIVEPDVGREAQQAPQLRAASPARGRGPLARPGRLGSTRRPRRGADEARAPGDPRARPRGRAGERQAALPALDGSRIRASHGHSHPVELGYAAEPPPAVLFHGTVARALDGIRARGLERGRRQHVHLSPSPLQAAEVARRRGAPIVLEILAAELAAAGHALRRAPNDVWLADAVPPAFIRFPD